MALTFGFALSSDRLVGVSPTFNAVASTAALVVDTSPHVVTVVAPFYAARAALVFNHVFAFVVKELTGKVREAGVCVVATVVGKSMGSSALDIASSTAKFRWAIVFFKGVSKGCAHDTQEDYCY